VNGNHSAPSGRRLKHEHRIFLLCGLATLPAWLAVLFLLWQGGYSGKTQWTLILLIFGIWAAFAFAIRERVIRPLQTISNLLAALGEEDFSIRARGARRDDALGEVMLEVNSLSTTLREQRLGALEATGLLRTVMEEINLAVFTFDSAQRLKLVNRAGERLLAQPSERLLGRTATALGLGQCLEGEANRTLQMTFPGSMGRWGMRRSSFRQGGLPHQLLVLADLSQALREEERQAWQRLLRVLGHELNNSLAPIKSISGSLTELLAKESPPSDWREDLACGLGVITTRAEALSRFVDAYTRLARLPAPRRVPISITSLIQRVTVLETRARTHIDPGPNVTLQADPDQLEQLLINLLRNAVDANLQAATGLAEGQPPAGARLFWTKTGTDLEVCVEDQGSGLPNTTNLFVPFFTTKPGGSGIGLVISRQIAEAHGGSLSLENRREAKGCIARLRLPLN
jgi:two-component system nitrogen regulation sensor histidine kinase NtrY